MISLLHIRQDLPPVLGVGSLLKNTVCVIANGQAHLSDVVPVLDSVAAFRQFTDNVSALVGGHAIARVAHDWHPDFYNTHFAKEMGPTPYAVQHHQAHIAAVMAEHGERGPVLGLALDGFGLGEAGELWGGELLLVDGSHFRRVGRLRPMPQPGVDAAARAPWRMGAAALHALGRGGEIASRYDAFPEARALQMMLEHGVRCPLTSSAGRLFDAACGLLDVVPVASYEGEAPITLEKLAKAPTLMKNGWKLREEGGLLTLDMRPVLARLAECEEAEDGANLFHGTLVAALAHWVRLAAQITGVSKLACGGGCFFNGHLKSGLVQSMSDCGIDVLMPIQLTPGDTAVSLGQAYTALLSLEEEG